MANKDESERQKNLLENFKPISDPTLRNYRPGSGPVIDPMKIPDIKPGPAIGGKPGEGGGKPDGGGSSPGGGGGNQGGGQRS
jgi:hypothetical protein